MAVVNEYCNVINRQKEGGGYIIIIIVFNKWTSEIQRHFIKIKVIVHGTV